MKNLSKHSFFKYLLSPLALVIFVNISYFSFGQNGVSVGQSQEDGFGGEKRGTSTSCKCNEGERIRRFEVFYGGEVVKGIKVWSEKRMICSVGGTDEYKSESFSIPSDDYLISISFEVGKYTDWISFYTANGKNSGRIGGIHKTTNDMYNLPENSGKFKRIVGFKFWSTHHDIEGIEIYTEDID